MATQTAAPTATGALTLNHLFAQRVTTSGDRVALRRKVQGTWTDITWRGYRDGARKVGLSLLALGLGRGDAVAILSETRAEWSFCDLGILGIGGITVPIYHSNTAPEAAYILQDSDAQAVFVENLEQWDKVRGRLGELPNLKKVIIIDPADTPKVTAAQAPWQGDERVSSYEDFLKLSDGHDPERFEEAAQAAQPGDVVTFIYTSGTTGHPKGVILTHENAVAECDALWDALEITDDESTLMFLPLAHVFARVLHWMQLKAGYVVAFAETINKVVDNMGEVRPTFFAAVPRIYEKIHGNVMAKIEENPPLKRRYVHWALRNALEKDRRQREKEGVPLGLAIACALGGPATGKIKGNLTARLGGRLRYFISGGAPLSAEIAAFFHMLGYPIYEGYGLTETTAATHVNKPGAHKIGTVGRAVKGVECKIAPDGEILVRGGVVMRGYHKKPEATAEVLSQDGWFATGDVGEVDADGFLRITDRKKDLIVTAAGKNVAPQNVENHLKMDRFISQAALFGDKQRFCVALVTLNIDEVKKQLQTEGAGAPEAMEELAKHPRVRQLVEGAVAEKNRDLASYEQVKYFEILPKEFDVGDELTPSLKVKRKVVANKYKEVIDRLYANAAPGKE
ncbi:MAG: long-chain fatty acid--CoA ligase [Planctomycetes bacterium]|nr:long-chain fatty acid--CoA ligase [Planctomycetota bacterium]